MHSVHRVLGGSGRQQVGEEQEHNRSSAGFCSNTFNVTALESPGIQGTTETRREVLKLAACIRVQHASPLLRSRTWSKQRQ